MGLTQKWLCTQPPDHHLPPTLHISHTFPPTHTNSMSPMSHMLLTRFWHKFKYGFLGPSLKEQNCPDDICQARICPGNILPAFYSKDLWIIFEQKNCQTQHLFFTPNLFDQNNFKSFCFWPTTFFDQNLLDKKCLWAIFFYPTFLTNIFSQKELGSSGSIIDDVPLPESIIGTSNRCCSWLLLGCWLATSTVDCYFTIFFLNFSFLRYKVFS